MHRGAFVRKPRSRLMPRCFSMIDLATLFRTTRPATQQLLEQGRAVQEGVGHGSLAFMPSQATKGASELDVGGCTNGRSRRAYSSTPGRVEEHEEHGVEHHDLMPRSSRVRGRRWTFESPRVRGSGRLFLLWHRVASWGVGSRDIHLHSIRGQEAGWYLGFMMHLRRSARVIQKGAGVAPCLSQVA